MCNWKHVIKCDLYIKFPQNVAHSVQICAKFSCKNFTYFAQYFEYYAIILGGVFSWTRCMFAFCQISNKQISWLPCHVVSKVSESAVVRQMSLALFGSTGRSQFIHAHTQDKLTSRIDQLADKLRTQYSRFALVLCISAWHTVLATTLLLAHTFMLPDYLHAIHLSALTHSTHSLALCFLFFFHLHFLSTRVLFSLHFPCLHSTSVPFLCFLFFPHSQYCLRFPSPILTHPSQPTVFGSH